MNIIKIDTNNQVNGDGLRCVLWVSGCNHHCPECHNPETWDFNAGRSISVEDIHTLMTQLSKEEISGITITGGDPLAPSNRETVCSFCHEIKAFYPNKTIWIYTGYLYEDVKDYLADVDVLIDGPYKQNLNPGIGKLKWRGSSNQRVIDVQQSLLTHSVVEYCDFNGKPISQNEKESL